MTTGEEAEESTDSEDADIVSALQKDASMPIDEVLASRYAGKALAKLKETDNSESVGGSSVLKPRRKARESKSADSNIVSIDEKAEDEVKKGSGSSIKTCSSGNSNGDTPSPTSDGESLPPKEESDTSEDVSSSPRAKLINGETEKKSDGISEEKSEEKAKKLLTNGDVNDHKDEKAINGANDETKTDLVVEGRRIVPTQLSPKTSCVPEESPSYTGKGKSGGKGGKVKGSSAITTTTLSPSKECSDEATAASPTKTRRAALAEVKRKVLSQEDLDSEDEDEDDENYDVE
ncbi:hypothetical protein HAZT_HAZT003765 [Hyalella azteca]|uniref:Uncharacterized protein n=1 Tax=Hyalella azteca TaxID=294128 RepID=A0A6A0H242_HYAAZ|nr:hypothetical protein HAZT_HAZT003765 [Hyalella azteca]